MTPYPQIAVLGPTRIEHVAAAAGFDASHIRTTAYNLGAELAGRGWGLVIVPDRGVAIEAMNGYLDAGGDRLTGIIPRGGVSDPAGARPLLENTGRCHVVIDDLTWYEQHHRIAVESDAMVTIGLSCGTAAELIWTKWDPEAPPVSMVEGLSSPLPAELAAELRVDIVGAAGLWSWLDAAVAKLTEHA